MAQDISRDRREKATISRRLRAIRVRQNITQQELADATKMQVATIRRYESGTSAPAFWRLPLLARGLGVPLEALFCDPSEACLGSVVVSAATMRRIRLEGEPAIREIAGVLASQLESALRHARPLLDPPTSGPAFARKRVRKKPPASQAERLQGLRERATRLKQERQQADRLE